MMRDTEAGNRQYMGQTMRGQVVETGTGENPVVSLYRDAPNVIVSNEAAEDWAEGDTMAVEITEVKDTYMFGDRVEEDTPDTAVSENWRLRFHVAGHRFESKTFTDEAVAESVAEYLADKTGMRVEVERTR